MVPKQKLIVIHNASLLLAVISITLLWASFAEAGTITQTTCPIEITHSGVYSLATDVGPCATGVDGIDIRASWVTLFLNGHTIKGSATPGTCNTSTGISVGSTAGSKVSGVAVLGGGTVSNFAVGLLAQNSANSLAAFVTATALPNGCTNLTSLSFGFEVLAPGGGWNLFNNVVREPGISSIGVVVQDADHNALVGNDVNDSIFILDSSNNTIVANTANDNLGGFYVGSLSEVGGTCSTPAACPNSHNNGIHANTTNNNSSGSGLVIDVGATGNNITGNKSFGNQLYDMQDNNGNCVSNKWEGNHFKTANPLCIH
jgi:parallel beta-helix repeat protein